MINKIKYHYHLFLHVYHKSLIQDALCEDLKTRLVDKSAYHGERALAFGENALHSRK